MRGCRLGVLVTVRVRSGLPPLNGPSNRPATLAQFFEDESTRLRVVDAKRSEIGLLKPPRESGQKETRPTRGRVV
jgi:hypothetical protein